MKVSTNQTSIAPPKFKKNEDVSCCRPPPPLNGVYVKQMSVPGTRITRHAPLSAMRTKPVPMIALADPGTMVNVPELLTVNRSNPTTAYTTPAISHRPRSGLVRPLGVNVEMPGQRRRH